MVVSKSKTGFNMPLGSLYQVHDSIRKLHFDIYSNKTFTLMKKKQSLPLIHVHN
uniref:Uncharacterized protein n=1 Tax=Anguilla anguilla TaxID=7936 RepID=A0A0E9XDZ0_ANGAN